MLAIAAYKSPDLVRKKANSRITLRGRNDEKVMVTIEELQRAYKEWASTIHLVRHMKLNTTVSREDYLLQPSKLSDLMNMID